MDGVDGRDLKGKRLPFAGALKALGLLSPPMSDRRGLLCVMLRGAILRHPARLASTFFFPWETQFRRVASSSNRRTRRRGSQGAVEIFRRIPTQGIGQEPRSDSIIIPLLSSFRMSRNSWIGCWMIYNSVSLAKASRHLESFTSESRQGACGSILTLWIISIGSTV